MKRQSLFITIMIVALMGRTSIYDIQFVSVKGESINISSFANKKIVISAFDAANPNIRWLRRLDSLQRADTSLQVIAAPAKDFTGSADNNVLAWLQESRSLKFIMLKCTMVKKSAGKDQHSLFKWLTDVNENTHFDVDVETADQLFVVSERGILSSVLNADVPPNVLSDILHHEIEQPN